MSEQKTGDVQRSYDLVAQEYVRRIYDELRYKPLDRQLLDQFAADVRGKGLICDLGCGPGQVARYLHERGIEVCGVDLSAAMIEQGRRLNPDIEFHQQNMLAMTLPDESWAGIAAFYAIVNFPPADLPAAAREMFRLLKPGGLLLLSFHIGDSMTHLDEWWETKVCVDFYYFTVEQVTASLRSAGFHIEELIERDPYPVVEYQTRRAYVFARKPVLPPSVSIPVMPE
ncbi:MAG: class I SAM-dependent methyltransferase [Tepidisphaeraceae bacterium]|jgi:ubiquinone/menaquinone biosynthesis C-methylase UbiE